MWFYRIRAVFAAGVVCTLVTWSVPVRAQDGGATEKASFKTMIAANPNLSEALTSKDPKIPVDELKLLVKPLTLEELKTEAVGWLLLLKEKVQEISDTEIAIKRENLQIEAQKAAVKSLEEAKTALTAAQEAQANATPGTPEYEEATKKLEEAKENLKKAQEAIEEAVETEEELQEDEALRSALEEAEESKELEQAKQTLKDAKKAREDLEAGFPPYKQATEKIEALEAAIEAFEDAKEAQEKAEPDSPEYKEATQQLEKAQEAVKQAQEAIEGPKPETEETEASSVDLDKAATVIEDTEIDSTGETKVEGPAKVVDGEEKLEEQVEQLEETAKKLEAAAEAESELKKQLVANVTELQSERTAIIDRFKIVLDSLEEKGGEAESYRKYIQAVSGIEIDVADTEGLSVRLISWLKSEEGGLRWAVNFGKFVGIVVAAIIVSQIIGAILNQIMSRLGGVSSLLRQFIVMLVKRGGIVIGFLLALTALEVSLGPILALVGGASFVLAFALQSNIGNFASGLMLMVYKPFDVGDEVQMGDVWGFVDSITLGGTKILSFSNQLITIPNNTVWSSVITNNTGTEVRGVSISFKIGYDSPIPKVKDVLLDIYKAHPLILDEPEAFMFPWQFKDSAIVILTTAFTKTENRWKVYEELFALIQERFAKEGIDMIDYSEVNLHYLSNSQIPTSGEMAQLTAQLSKEATPTPPQTI